MTSRTSEMASLDSNIPPSTHCSAGMSFGGVRSKSSRGAISATLTRLHPLFGPVQEPLYRTALTISDDSVGMTVFSDGRATSNRAVHRSVDSLCRHAVQAVRYLGITL